MNPPRLADRLLALFCAPHLLEAVQGDLHEEFDFQVQRIGERKARCWYWREVMGFLKPFAVSRQPNSICTPNPFSMALFFNYLTLALRNAGRHRATTFVNVLGLTTGLTACLLIATFVLDELSFDRFWSKTDQLYRLVQVRSNGAAEERSAYLISGFAPKIQANFPEVSAYTRDTKARRVHLSHGGKLLKTDVWRVESGAFRMFDFQFLRGSVDTSAFHHPTLVLNETTAKALFGEENPVGKTVMQEIPYAPAKPFTVVGVIRDLPSNSHLRADALRPTQLDASADEAIDFGYVFPQYLLLTPNANPGQLAAKASDYFNRTFKPKEKIRLDLQPITDVHLRSGARDDTSDRQSDIRYVYLFSAIGVFLLLLACINYVNFTTARALQRARETGIRKVLGANRAALVRQFLTESLLVFGSSLVVALGLYALGLPALYAFIGRTLTVTPFANFRLLAAVIGAAMTVGVLAGLYPAFVLSAFQPSRVLRGLFRREAGAFSLRSGLVVAQFAVSLVLIVATLVVYRQLRFVNEVNLGYRKDNLLLIEGQPEEKAATFKQELLRNPNILGVSLTNWQPGTESEGSQSSDMEDPKQRGQKLTVWGINADFDFLKTLQIQLVAGREFDATFASDRLNLDSLLAQSGSAHEAARKDKSIIVNETLVRKLGLRNPVGQQLTHKSLKGRIIGVMKDIHSGPLHRAIPAMFLQASPENRYGSPLIRVRAGKLAETTVYVERLWKRLFPDRLFEYHYADEQLENLYRSEQRLGYLFGGFAGLAVLICCLGLFGLATFTAEQRTKEIGVRKVLGASVASIVALLSKDFLKLVLVAIVLASPLAWWAMTKWLENFAYKISLSWWMFAGAGLLAVGVALLTVSLESVKAALMNPVKSLRSE